MSGRRVVVAGPYPTMPGPEAAATFSLVRRLVADGDDVTVVSPVPSAAHHTADPGGPRGATKLAQLVRGAEVLHLRLDAAAVGAASDARSLFPGRLALRTALARVGRAEVRLDRVPSTVSRQWANLVLGKAAQVLVATEDERAALLAAGVSASVVVVAPEPEPEVADHPPIRLASAAPLAGAVDAAAIEQTVRKRAAEARTLDRSSLGNADLTATIPLRHLERMERAPVRSAKPGGVFVKRLISKALQWQFDNVIASVNRLHHATLDAIENLEAERLERLERDERR